MKLLVIGATGQVGHALTHALVGAGHEVSALVRRAEDPALPAAARLIVEPSFTEATFARALAGVDAVVYGVGLPEQFTFDAGVFERVNLGLFQAFTRALEASAVRRLVYISTYEVFQSQGGLIRETHPLADPTTQSPYFAAMTRAYAHATAFAARTGTRLTTIHPAALYGGLNTGDGFTNVIENLLHWRLWNLPVVLPGRFPLVHAQSLAQAVVQSLDHDGAFLVSDGMSCLKDLALALRSLTRSYVPPVVPAGLAYAATAPVEALARLLRFRPMLCQAQLDFITQGTEPLADRAAATLGWRPLPLRDGLRRYLDERELLLARQPATGGR